MPYFICEKADPDTRTHGPYATREDAHANVPNVRTHAVRYVDDPRERLTWQARERERFADGTYIRTPWAVAGLERYVSHYCHVSRENLEQVAYTPDEESGYRDRQVRCRPGKYLEEFYSEYFDKARRDRWIAEIIASAKRELKITSDPEECQRIYEGRGYSGSAGWQSCMGPISHVSFRYGHPAVAYGGSDLALAYLGPIDAVLARSVVWPDKKIYTRIYGAAERMTAELERAGYRKGTMHGARLRRVNCEKAGTGAIYMPYIDGFRDDAHPYGQLDPHGEYITLGVPGGNVSLHTSTHGYQYPRGLSKTCEYCGDRRCALDRRYCPQCEENSHVCGACGGAFVQDSPRYAINLGPVAVIVCAMCVDNDPRGHFTCELCDATYYEWAEDVDTQVRRQRSRLAGRACDACTQPDEETGDPGTRVCHGCGALLYDNGDACDACGVPDRCAFTLSLLDLLEPIETIEVR